jgi:CTP synthase (UTP-ammonia lyase)
MSTPRLALVGDRSPHVVAHGRIPAALAALDGPTIDVYWVGTDEVDADELVGFDGVWLVPGSPYASEAGAVEAVRVAREAAIPFFGSCGGFQHAYLEFARHVAGMPDAQHAEVEPDADRPVIAALACSLVGHEEAVDLAPGTLAAGAAGSLRRTERYSCSFGPVAVYEPSMVAAGLVVSGRDEAGRPRVIELAAHPFFLATLFQPELAESQPHPLVAAFGRAVQAQAAGR